MRKLTGQQIRETWLKFFESKGHHIEKGANLIPYNDPSLLWLSNIPLYICVPHLLGLSTRH